MKNTSILRYSLFLGASALLLSQGCGEGGPGAGINTIEPPFGSAPPSDDRGGNPSGANNPFKASAPTSNDGYQSSPESGGYNAPSTSGGGFEAPPGSGNCINAIKQFYDRCGLLEEISQYPEALAQIDQVLNQICGAISAAPSCSACVLSQLPTLSCDVVEDDNNEGNQVCNAACAGVDFGFDDGGGGSGGGGGAAGSGGGGNLCSRCGILDACPQLEFSSSECAQVCNQAPPGCEPCIVAAGTNCDQIGACLATACFGGGGGSGGSGGSGGGGGGTECAKLASCCPGLDPNFQPSCNAAVEQGQDATCKGFFDSVCAAQLATPPQSPRRSSASAWTIRASSSPWSGSRRSSMIPGEEPLIRPALDADLPDILAIYGHAVLRGTGTFETEVPSLTEMARRRGEVLERGLPFLVAERAGGVLGYAYGNWFRPRQAYRYFIEDSVYLRPEAQGQGVGRRLLEELIARCEEVGARQMVAVIGDSQNLASIGLHRALGFEQTGLLRASGWKFDRWLDVVLMQRALGVGDRSPPG